MSDGLIDEKPDNNGNGTGRRVREGVPAPRGGNVKAFAP